MGGEGEDEKPVEVSAPSGGIRVVIDAFLRGDLVEKLEGRDPNPDVVEGMNDVEKSLGLGNMGSATADFDDVRRYQMAVSAGVGATGVVAVFFPSMDARFGIRFMPGEEKGKLGEIGCFRKYEYADKKEEKALEEMNRRLGLMLEGLRAKYM